MATKSGRGRPLLVAIIGPWSTFGPVHFLRDRALILSGYSFGIHYIQLTHDVICGVFIQWIHDIVISPNQLK